MGALIRQTEQEFRLARERAAEMLAPTMESLGISKLTMLKVGGVASAYVRDYDDTYFELTDSGDGKVRFVMPVLYGWRWLPEGTPGIVHPAPEDLIAWSPANPDDWRVRTGNIQWLHAEAVDQAKRTGNPLRLNRTPLSWLQSGAEGSVILWLRKHEVLRQALDGVEDIICDDEQHAESVHAALRRLPPQPSRPKLHVAAGERIAP